MLYALGVRTNLSCRFPQRMQLKLFLQMRLAITINFVIADGSLHLEVVVSCCAGIL